MYEYKVLDILKVVDGDTIDCRISKGFGETSAFRFRLFGLDAPELSGKYADPIGGPAARDFVVDWLTNHTMLKVKTEKGSQSTVGIGDGAFGRWLATFIDRETGETLQDAMIDAGHVKETPSGS